MTFSCRRLVDYAYMEDVINADSMGAWMNIGSPDEVPEGQPGM